jgi:hypothetical protein
MMNGINVREIMYEKLRVDVGESNKSEGDDWEKVVENDVKMM